MAHARRLRRLGPAVARPSRRPAESGRAAGRDAGRGLGGRVWFFVLPNDVIGKLTLGHVGLEDTAWRISYPGLVPHGGYLDPEYGLVVAYAHGPKNFVMRYEEPSVMGTGVLGTNSWIDFTGKTPKLLD